MKKSSVFRHWHHSCLLLVVSVSGSGINVMKKFALAAAFAAATVVAAPAAYASPVVSFNPATGTGVFFNNDVVAGAINDVFQFDYVGNGLATADITAITFDIAQAITNVSVTFNGQDFFVTEEVVNINGSDVKRVTGFINNVPVTTGTQTLVVKGESAGNNTYTGNIRIKVSPVPEPATWALMIVGFGMVGSTLRRRRTVLA